MFKYYRFVFLLISTVCLIVMFNLTALGQADATSIGGTVTDASDAAVAGVKVELQSPTTGLHRDTVTNAEGIYLFPALPVGSYKINVSKEGFRPVQILNIRLEVGQPRTVDVH